MSSQFPLRPEVALRFSVEEPVSMKLWVRTPVWATAEMPIAVNGKQVAVGKPGGYVVLDRMFSGHRARGSEMNRMDDLSPIYHRRPKCKRWYNLCE